MKTFFTVLMLCFTTVAFGADAAPAAVPASTGIFAWFQSNTNAVIVVALAVSEFLSLIPAFQGNGILDTIIKALKALSAKPTE